MMIPEVVAETPAGQGSSSSPTRVNIVDPTSNRESSFSELVNLNVAYHKFTSQSKFTHLTNIHIMNSQSSDRHSI